MRIGILPSSTRLDGGTYQYGLTMMNSLRQMNMDDDFVVFHRPITDLPLDHLAGQRWETILLGVEQGCTSFRSSGLNVLRRIAGEGVMRKLWRKVRHRFFPPPPNESPRYLSGDFDTITYRWNWKRWLERQGIELMIYLDISTLSFETGIPYIMTVYDLQHRLQPEFPEVSAEGEWERREYFFRNGTRYATLILVDSEVGKEDVLEFYGPYGVTPDKVKVLPSLPANYHCNDIPEEEEQRIRKAYSLPDRYLFYPAQFWPHKNHFRIVQALGMLREDHHFEIHLVLVGSYTGKIRERTFREVMSLASKLGIEQQIHYLGYVPDQDMPALYSGAVALVMPTFFGPTNIPILEAWSFGCPALTSDIRGIREQVGDAGFLVNPRSVEAIADGIQQLWNDYGLCKDLANRGRQRLLTYTPEDCRRRLTKILEEAKERVRQTGSK